MDEATGEPTNIVVDLSTTITTVHDPKAFQRALQKQRFYREKPMDRKQKRDALFTRNDREPVDLGDGVVVEVRSLTVKEARLLRKQEDHEDYAGLMALCACTYDPQTGEKMFDWPADKDVLESAAMGWVQRLLNEVNVVNGWVQRDDEGNSSKESTPNSDDSGEGVEN